MYDEAGRRVGFPARVMPAVVTAVMLLNGAFAQSSSDIGFSEEEVTVLSQAMEDVRAENHAGRILPADGGLHVAMDERLARDRVNRPVGKGERMIDFVKRAVIGGAFLGFWFIHGPVIAIFFGAGFASARGEWGGFLLATAAAYFLPVLFALAWIFGEPERFAQRDLIHEAHFGNLPNLDGSIDLLNVRNRFGTEEAWAENGERRDDVNQVALEFELYNRADIPWLYGEAVCRWGDLAGGYVLVTRSPVFSREDANGGRHSSIVPGVVGRAETEIRVEGMQKLFDRLLDQRNTPHCVLVGARGKERVLSGEKQDVRASVVDGRLFVQNIGSRYIRSVTIDCLDRPLVDPGQPPSQQDMELEQVTEEFHGHLLMPGEKREVASIETPVWYCEVERAEDVPFEALKR